MYPTHHNLDTQAIGRLLCDIYTHRLVVAPHYAVSTSPETYEELCALTSAIMPILGEYCDDTIFYEPRVNVLQRALHDGIHLSLRADTSTQGEARVAKEQCRLIAHHSTIAADVHYVDSVGQTEYCNTYGSFPIDQVAFVYEVLKTGKV